MADPCEPASLSHHAHGPARIIGRIRRHGTRRLAHQLHPGNGGCLPGKAPLLVRKVLGKAVAPAGFAALAAAAPSIAASNLGAGNLGASNLGTSNLGTSNLGTGDLGAGNLGTGGGDSGSTGSGPGILPGGTGAPPTGRPGNHPPVTVSEPASLPLLLLGLLAVTTLRKWFRPRAVSRSRLGVAGGRS